MKNTGQYTVGAAGPEKEDFSKREVVLQLLTKSQRMQRVVTAAVSVAYALYSFLHDDFYLLGKHGPGTHFHGVAAGLLELALLLAALACLLPFAYLYDQRPVYPNYEKWRRYTAMAAYGCMGLGISQGVLGTLLSKIGGSPLLWLAGWLVFGALAAQFGRLPARYQVKKQQTAWHGGKMPSPVAYAVSIILWLIAAVLLLLIGGMLLREPGMLFSLLTWILLMLGLGSLAWGCFIFRRIRAAA